MFWRLAASLGVAIAFGSLVFLAWSMIHRHEIEHAADMLELESYATRSDLVKALDTQFQALRSVASYWDDYGHLSPDQWGSDARIELSHFEGIETILWNDPRNDVRYATATADGIDFKNRPTDEQWQTLQPLLDGVDPARGAAVLGRGVDEDGHFSYRVQVPARGPGATGVLVADIDAHAQLELLLADRSPGQAITVSWDGERLYQRDEPAADIPESWRREGLIELSVGPLWRVEHAPTAQTADALVRPTIPGLLIAGWVIAALLGGLVYQMSRVRERALAAERAERHNARLNQELEARVEERTSELAERTSDLETISQSVSHDIRNPMNTIALTVRLMRQQTADDAQLGEAVTRIESALSQMTDVVERLSTYSQVAFVSFERERVNMRELAEGVREQLADAGAAAQCQVEIGELPACRAQPMLVEILWHNLIGNALKYSSGRDAPKIQVGAEAGSGPTVYYVRDNGMGFDAERAEELFRPFTRGDHGVDGQGLGLAIVARIVGRHGGRVWAESVPGDGAAFMFHLGEESVLGGEAPAGDSAPHVEPVGAIS